MRNNYIFKEYFNFFYISSSLSGLCCFPLLEELKPADCGISCRIMDIGRAVVWLSGSWSSLERNVVTELNDEK